MRQGQETPRPALGAEEAVQPRRAGMAEREGLDVLQAEQRDADLKPLEERQHDQEGHKQDDGEQRRGRKERRPAAEDGSPDEEEREEEEHRGEEPASFPPGRGVGPGDGLRVDHDSEPFQDQIGGQVVRPGSAPGKPPGN